MASSEQDKRLRAELAEGLGFYPASLSHEDVAHYRYQIAERQAREEAGERGTGRLQVAPVGSPREERRRTYRNSGTRIGGRPVRVSRDANERGPSAPIRRNPQRRVVWPIAVTEISRDAARRTGRPGPGATAEGGRRARYRYVAAVNAKSVELQ